MDTNEMLDETIGRWLQDTAPARLPERVLDTTFERTRRTRQHVGLRAFLRKLRIPRFAPALGGAAVVVAATAVWLGMYADQTGIGGPVTFVGTWESHADADGGHQTMEIAELADGTYDVTIRDDVATVCGLTPSTMTGVAEAHEPGTIVIAQPVYVCDDGSDAETLSGPPLEAVLQDLGFTYDPASDEVLDSFDVVWTRVGVAPGGAAESSTAPAASDAQAEAESSTPAPSDAQAEAESSTPAPSDAQAEALVGIWEATDPPPDSSHLTMDLRALADGRYDVTIRDDVATVCGLTPSTMTGVAEAHEPGTIVIAHPVYVCDDGSDAETLSGPPLEAVLQDLGFTYDAERDAFQDSLGLVWSRVEATP